MPQSEKDGEGMPREGGAPAGGEPGAGQSGGYRFGYVTIAGRPNVGKSTLMNRFLQERLAIVTEKPQTTRRRTLGILSSEGYQMILLDTPGLMDPRYDLHHAMLQEARQAISDADLILFLTEPHFPVEIPREVAAPPSRGFWPSTRSTSSRPGRSSSRSWRRGTRPAVSRNSSPSPRSKGRAPASS
jgi:hypothetical protein